MPLDQLHEHEAVKAEMSFFDHINELRRHLMRSVAAIAVVGTVAFLNKDFIFDDLLFGPRKPDFFTYRALCSISHTLGMGEAFCLQPTKFTLMTRELGEVLMQHLSVAFWLGVIGAFPYILYQFWKFIQPGLLETEQKAVRGIVFICSLLFLTGVMFGYYIIAPFSISFLAGYTLEGLNVAPTLDSYVSYMTMFTLPIGMVFEMPIIFYFLAKIGLVGKKFLQDYRRHAVVIILILAAVITPPDVASQMIVMTPLLLLYEVSIIVVGRVQKRREKGLYGSSKEIENVD
ncbi:MAG: twin-arginine translocase subunit TatC [Lewinellaceae bacterium]|nr:twin-arginine translocase subunit TatC [Lewinellaceae bacterium]